MMKIICFLLIILCSCTNDQPASEPPMTTVDSNVVVTGDSIPLNPQPGTSKDTSSDIAMDSAGPLILPTDTSRY